MSKEAFLLLFITIIGLSACKKDACKDREYQAINQVVADQIPYQTGQIVQFKTSTGEKFMAIADRLSEVNRPDAPLICQDYLYVTLKTGGNLFVEYVQRGSVQKTQNLQMSLYPLRTNRGSIVQMTVADDGTLGSVLASNIDIQHDSLEIDGKVYEHVLEIKFEPNSIPDNADLTQLFYNKSYGIIQYATYSGIVVTRVD